MTDGFLNRLSCWSSCPTVASPQHFFFREPPKRICYIPRNPFPGISSETRLQRGNWQYTEITPVLPVAVQKKSLSTSVDMPNCKRYFRIYSTIYRGARYDVRSNTGWETVLRQNLHTLKQNSISWVNKNSSFTLQKDPGSPSTKTSL